MAQLGSDPEREKRAASRSCGTCSLCCSVLRVDPIGKRAGEDCVHQRGPEGCGIYETRPPICRGYQCLWLQGGLEDHERPDRTGGIVDLETTGIGLRLAIREGRRGVFDESNSLQAIAERYRDQMPVRITDAEDVLNPDRHFRVLLPEGVEQRVSGELIEIYRNGVFEEQRRQPWAERILGRLMNAWRSHTLKHVPPQSPGSE